MSGWRRSSWQPRELGPPRELVTVAIDNDRHDVGVEWNGGRGASSRYRAACSCGETSEPVKLGSVAGAAALSHARDVIARACR